MRSRTINFVSVLVLVLSCGALYYLIPRVVISWENRDVVVKGVSNQQDAGIFSADKRQSLEEKEAGQLEENFLAIANPFLIFNPDAPTKKDGYGDLYLRSAAEVAIDAETGTILHERNATQKLPIASLTKVMTAIVVLDNIKDLDNTIVTVDREVASADASKVGCPTSTNCDSNPLEVGEQVSARNLFDSMLVGSTNDAAIALAKKVAGSQAEFAKLMNQKAKELGLSNTQFCNPSGLDPDNSAEVCYSTAYDFARISAYSLRYDEIWRAFRLAQKDFYSTDGQILHQVKNTNLLLEEMANCEGAKTGFTFEAGKTLMMVAHHPVDRKIKVVGVMLNNNKRWEDIPKMFQWCFDAYRWPKDVRAQKQNKVANY